MLSVILIKFSNSPIIQVGHHRIIACVSVRVVSASFTSFSSLSITGSRGVQCIINLCEIISYKSFGSVRLDCVSLCQVEAVATQPKRASILLSTPYQFQMFAVYNQTMQTSRSLDFLSRWMQYPSSFLHFIHLFSSFFSSLI